MPKYNLWAPAVYLNCQEQSSNDKEAAKAECTFAHFNVTEFNVKYEINLMMTLEIQPVILRLSRKAKEFLDTCSNKEVLKINKRILQLKIINLPVNMGDKNLCLLLNAHTIILGACLPLK